MKKLLSMLMLLTILVPTFGTLPAFAGASADDETKSVAALYDADGTFMRNYDSVSIAMVYACANTGNRKVKLLADSIEDTPVNVIGGSSTTLDLNGHKLKRNQGHNMTDKNGSVITLGESADLKIIDSSDAKSGTIEGGGAKWGGGIYAPNDNVVTMEAGTITDCTAYYGGGVYIDEGSKFTMKGGKINGCSAKYGGGVYAEDKATFETHHGEISDCVAEEDGGGIYIWSAYANLERCYIANNRAEEDGGGIFSDYSASKIRSSLTVDGSSIVNNTAGDCYGGIYHCRGKFVLKNGTIVSSNKSNGKYGGGVYSEGSSIELSGSVLIYGNYSGIDEPCDVSFGSNLSPAFKLNGELSTMSLIGVNTRYHTPGLWYDDSHVSYGSCDNNGDVDTQKANTLKDALFSNNSNIGFSSTFKSELGELYEHRHYVKIISREYVPDDSINVTQVLYKNIQLTQGDYTAEYNPKSRAIVLTMPDYVKDLGSLSVNTDRNNIHFWNGTIFSTDYTARYGLIVKNSKKSKTYTVSVEGGMVDSIAPDDNGISSTQKKFFDDLSIKPIVPEDKVFSHWEVEGDYAISSIKNFNQYTKIPLNMLMPNGNVKFKAIFRTKVTDVDVYMTTPVVGKPTPFYGKAGKDPEKNPWIKAKVRYTMANGTTRDDLIDINWNKEDEMFDGTAIHYFDYFAKYLANFQVEDTPDGDFGLADEGELKVNLYVNGNHVESNFITNYEYVYGDGYNWQWSNDNNPIKQRILHATHYYRSEKAPVKKAIPTQISVQPDTTKEDLIKLLPGSVNVEIADINYTNGEEQNQTTDCPVEWNTNGLPDRVTESIKITGTLNTENKGFEVKSVENIEPAVIVDPITEGKSRMPQITVDGTPVTAIDGTAKIALGKKIKLTTSMAGATIYYKLDGKQFEYTTDYEIEISGEKDNITTHEFEAYAQRNEEKSEILKLTIEVDNKTTYTVDILDPDGKKYKYAEGGGEYKLGNKVSVDLTRAYMVNEGIPGSTEKEWVPDPHKIATAWSAKGILLDEEQKTKPVFEFEMPNSNVIIKIEKFENRNKVHTVTIVDKDDKTYEYALGAGEYKVGDRVTIDSTQFMLRSVDADGKVTSEPTNAPEKVVSKWSAKGIKLSEDQVKAGKFEFEMPYNDVIIKAESFRYLVKKLYLSSLTPIAGQVLPDELDIISARDANGNLIDKDDIMLKIELPEGSKWACEEKELEPGTIVQDGKTYTTLFSVQALPNTVAFCDSFEIYIGDKKVDSIWGPYLISVMLDAVRDELVSVDWADTLTYYKATDAIEGLPNEVNVRTKYGTIEKAEVDWDGKDQLKPYFANTSKELTATLKLPDYIDAADSLKTKKVTVKIAEHADSVILKVSNGKIPAKAGERLPSKGDVYISNTGTDYKTKLGDFKVLTEDGEDVSGKIAVGGEKYTVQAEIVPNVDYIAFSDSTQFTINGKAMTVTDRAKNPITTRDDIHYVSYSFVAEEVKKYTVVVNGKSLGEYQNGDTVEISTADTAGFCGWTAEAVYTENGVEYRSPVSLFKDDGEYKTSFVMPLLVDDNAKLEITANYAYGITAYDPETKKATVISDKDYSNAAVIFATYGADGTLLSAKSVNTDLLKGQYTVIAPNDFSVNDGEVLKVMVWNNMDDIIPLFADFEQTYEEKSEETDSTDDSGESENTGDAENVENMEGTKNEN